MKNILTKILSISLGILIIGEILYSSIANSIKEESIKESIKNNLLTGLIYNEKGEKTDIFNTILKLTKLDEETVLKLMKNETADRYITDIVNSIYDYNLTGDEKYKYTKEKIIKIIEDNVDQVLNEINYVINNQEKEELINYVKNNSDYIIDTIYSTNIGGYTK